MKLRDSTILNIVFNHGGFILRKRFFKVLCTTLVTLNVFTMSVRANANYNSIENFVARTYEVFLYRDAKDDIGVEYWSYLIRNHEMSLYDYMISFLSGDEFSSREVSDEEFLNMIYRILFNRDINDDEKIYWMEKLYQENKTLRNVKDTRLKIGKMIFSEPILKEISSDLGVTFNFKNLNDLGVSDLKKDYSDSKIEYINSFYRGFAELWENLHNESVENIDRNVEHAYELLPIFTNQENKGQYEELVSVSDGTIRRIVHSLDYDIKFPYGVDKSVYISSFLQMNKGERLNFVTLGLGITNKGFEKNIDKVELLLGDESIELEFEYEDNSRYESDGISLHEFEFNIKSVNDLMLIDKMLNSDLSKLRFTFEGSDTYIYNLYEKDRIRNTLRFMWSMYLQIIVSYLFESKDIFDKVISNNLE